MQDIGQAKTVIDKCNMAKWRADNIYASWEQQVCQALVNPGAHRGMKAIRRNKDRELIEEIRLQKAETFEKYPFYFVPR